MKNNIPIANFNYILPDDRIAKYPLEHRESSKLLIYKARNISESHFSNLQEFLPAHSLLVMNNTKVIRARLFFKKESGAQIEVFCLEPHSPADYYQSFQSRGSCDWQCMVGNLKKWKQGKISLELFVDNQSITIWAEKLLVENEKIILHFSWQPEHLSFALLLDKVGQMPIPPYLNRNSELIDQSRYQTVFASPEGSVAAPTAGLHFTDPVFETLHKKQIKTQTITLHVGAGTFKPVKEENALEHPMHTERFFINTHIVNALKHFEGSITSVGTTSLRALESIYWVGVKLGNNHSNPFHIEQFDPYQLKSSVSLSESIQAILNYFQTNKIDQIEASTAIMIVPGYEFKVVNRLITNFHQPKSTLLLLVSAFVGENNWKTICDYALTHDFRFLSYGDSSLLERH